MICPYCQTENRDDREACYYCKKDLSMLRLIVNKAKHHYNQGLEFAERGRIDDAINEMKNALDLDGTMDNAQVVLGTLYAKKEMFAEARECWQRALALHHNLGKAHEYLHKAGKAEYVFPAIRRLKMITLILSGALVLLLISTIWLGVLAGIKDKDMERVAKAASLIRVSDDAKADDTQLGVAYAQLAEVASNPQATPTALQLAKAISSRIAHEWQRRLDLARSATGIGDTYAAFLILDSIRQDRPTNIQVLKSIDRSTSSTQMSAIQRVHDMYDDFTAHQLPYERFHAEAVRFQEYVRNEPAQRDLTALQNRVENEQRVRQRTEAMEVIAHGSILQAVGKVREWEAKDRQEAASLNRALNQRLATEEINANAEVNNLIEQHKFVEAEKPIAALKLAYEQARLPLPNGLIAKLSADIQEGQRQAAFDDAMEAFNNRNWESFLTLTQKPDELTNDVDEVYRIQDWREEATNNSNRETVAWFRTHEGDFREEKMTIALAQRAIKTYPVAMEHRDLDPALTTATLWFEIAMAHLKLEQPAEAIPLLRQVTARYSKSPQAKTAAALLKKLETPKTEPAAKPVAAGAPAKPAAATPAKPATGAAAPPAARSARQQPPTRQGGGRPAPPPDENGGRPPRRPAAPPPDEN